MNRRKFIKSSAAAAVTSQLFARKSAPSDPFTDLNVRIERIHCFRTMYDRPRIVGGNSGYKLAGGQRGDWMIALFGNNGVVGLGSAPRYGRPRSSDFPVGKTVAELMSDELLATTAEEIGTTALWDFAGKTLGRPVYELLGGQLRPDGVPVYDGSIYMEELVNRDANSAYRNPNATYGRRPHWTDLFQEAVDISRALGHNFAKVKIGRGHLHLDRTAGNLQDAAVLREIRRHAGSEFKIGVDANNGYSLEDTLWLLREHGDVGLEFIEEMFPEAKTPYQQLQETIRELGLRTLVADGENWTTAYDEGVPELIKAGVIDVLQGDMRMFQIEGILAEADLAAAAGHGALIAPHNWGCEYAFYVMIHMGNVIPHYYGAEHDPGTIRVPVMRKQGYEIIDGRCFAPDIPGFGIELDESLLDQVETVYSYSV